MQKFRKRGIRSLAALFCGLRLDRLLIKTQSLRGSKLKVLVYHRVMNITDRESFPYDSGLIDASVDGFEKQMRYVGNNFDLIGFSEVIEHLDTGKKLPRNPLLITFDDGFEDNYRLAYPVLRAHEIPATIFITTDYIGKSRTFWYDWLAFIILNTPSLLLEVKELSLSFPIPANQIARIKVIPEIMRFVRELNDDQRKFFLESIEEKYGEIYESQSDECKALSQPLNWDQIREMHAGGVEIGSHTVTHPFLSKVSKNKLYSELIDSKMTIEKEISSDVTVLAYPNGQKSDYNQDVVMAAREAGYKLALTYVNGVNKIGGLHRYEMMRMHLPTQCDLQKFKLLLSLN